jgi:hypothetical protein
VKRQSDTQLQYIVKASAQKPSCLELNPADFMICSKASSRRRAANPGQSLTSPPRLTESASRRPACPEWMILHIVREALKILHITELVVVGN